MVSAFKQPKHDKLARMRLKADLTLLLAALVWGLGFIAQRNAALEVGALLFNAARWTLGGLVMLPFIRFNLHLDRKTLPWMAAGGFILFAASGLQQTGLKFTTAGNAGFITTLYVIMVPIFGLFWNHKTNLQTWIGALLATIGLYFLSVSEKLNFSPGDGIVLISAVFFAFHVLIIGRLSPRTDPIKISIIQFTVCAFLSFIFAFLTEEITWHGIWGAAIPLLYGGVFSIGIAFTLQVIGQRKAKPAHAAIILSLESLFAAFGGWLLLSEGFTTRGLIGCGLMLAGIIISQLNRNNHK